MKKLFALFSIFALSACSGGGGGGGSSEVVDPVYGEWYYQAPGATSTQAKGVVASLNKDGTVKFANVYLYTDGSNSVAHTRKSIGTYVRNGSEFTFTYSYETCSAVGSEKLTIKMSGDKLLVDVPSAGLTLTMSRMASNSTINTAAAIEDKNCNILSKIEQKQKRQVASDKPKSFFDRIVK